MTIELGVNSSETNKLTKTVSYTQTLNGSLKNESDVVRPEVLVQGLSGIDHINYMRIQEFGRVYFVDDIKVVRDNLFLIQAHCDVLSSFASEIRANSAIIKKQENQFNLYLDDGTFKAYQNSNVGILNFNGNSFNTTTAGSSYLLAVAGG